MLEIQVLINNILNLW